MLDPEEFKVEFPEPDSYDERKVAQLIEQKRVLSNSERMKITQSENFHTFLELCREAEIPHGWERYYLLFKGDLEDCPEEVLEDAIKQLREIIERNKSDLENDPFKDE